MAGLCAAGSLRPPWIRRSRPGVRAIPNRVGVSGGPGKALANIGAVRAGLLNVLITDQYTAAEMLGILKNEEAPTNLDARPA